MNYQKLHDQIINNSRLQNRIRSSDTYHEDHHIIPWCMNGTDEENNKVLLTAREHFIMHWILIKLHPGNNKLVFAINSFEYNRPQNVIGGRSKLYQLARLKYSNMLKQNKEWKKKISETMSNMVWVKNISIGRCTRIRKDMLQEYLDKGYVRGRITFTKSPLSDETKLLISKGNIGKMISDHHKFQISKAIKGKIWVNKNNKTRMIDINDISNFIKSGWVIGRGYDTMSHGANRNRIAITKDGKCKYIEFDKLDDFIINGWVLGNGRIGRKIFSDYHLKDISNRSKNTILINNTVINKQIKKYDLKNYDGWKLGRIRTESIGKNQYIRKI